MTESIGFRAQVSIPGPLKKNVSRVGPETGRRGLSVSKITKLLCLPVFQDVLVSKVNRLSSSCVFMIYAGEMIHIHK